jgi:hypothetical protein
MRPKDTRKALGDIARLCRAHGLEVELQRAKGKGSHQALIFCDPRSGARVPLVIAGGQDISPGVQRKVLSYLRTLAGRLAAAEAARALADRVAELLDAYFNH